MFRAKFGLCAIVVVSTACLASVAAAGEGKAPADKLLNINAEIDKVTSADHVKVRMGPPLTSYRSARTVEDMPAIGCVYLSSPSNNGTVTELFDILRQGITAYHGVPHAYPPPDVRFEIDFMKGDKLLGAYYIGENYGGDYVVEGLFPSGWGTVAAEVPTRLRTWAKRADVHKADPASEQCKGQ